MLRLPASQRETCFFWCLPKHGSCDTASGVSVGNKGIYRVCGGFQRGRCPLCVVAEEGVTGEKPHRKGFSLRAVFWLLFVRTRSSPGWGAGEAPRKGGYGAESPEIACAETQSPRGLYFLLSSTNFRNRWLRQLLV